MLTLISDRLLLREGPFQRASRQDRSAMKRASGASRQSHIGQHSCVKAGVNITASRVSCVVRPEKFSYVNKKCRLSYAVVE